MKMKIRMVKGSDDVNWKEASALLELVGLGARNPEQLLRAFGRSKAVFAYDGNRLIGIGRAVTDEEYYATIFDVGVRPEYQRKGIGRKIIESLMQEFEGFWFVHLTSTPGNEAFYQKLGFRLQKTAMTVIDLPDYPENEIAKLVE